MNKQEAYITFIEDQLKAGNMSFNKVFELNQTKFDLTRSTFSKYWKIANERHSKAISVINEAKTEEYIATEKEALNGIIKTKHERLLFLQSLLDTCLVELERIEKPDIKIQAAAKIKDIQAEISKIEGDYAASKVENEVSVNNKAIMVLSNGMKIEI
jgi:hypothetical protein